MIDKHLKKVVFGLSKFPEVKWVKLFGSRARGDNTECSDYDLAVYVDGDASLWFDVNEYLEREIIIPLDVIDYKNTSGDIIAHIDRQGELIFLNEKWFISLSRLGEAMVTLEEVLKKEDTEDHIVRDSTLQRFEYTIEILWKTLKHLERKEGKEVFTPREAISTAYEFNWINDDKKWIQMFKDRNNISRCYNEDLAEEIYNNIKRNFEELKVTYEKLKEIERNFIDRLEG